MDRVTVDLKHCYGIKALKKELDFLVHLLTRFMRLTAS